MTTVTQGAVQSLHPGMNLKDFQNLIHHNGDMHSGRRIALADHMTDLIRILLRVLFLIFLFKLTGIFPAVVNSSLVGFVLVFHSYPHIALSKLYFILQ